MVAGATGVDLFVLVVACDDGVMPQTREHLAILELLGVNRGVVALTKADLVDAELLALAEADVRECLASTPYAEAPIVAVSARDGHGIAKLLDVLDEEAAAVEGARGSGPTRLPIDRSFSLKGVGMVVTGTLWRGTIAPATALGAARRRSRYGTRCTGSRSDRGCPRRSACRSQPPGRWQSLCPTRPMARFARCFGCRHAFLRRLDHATGGCARFAQRRADTTAPWHRADKGTPASSR